MIELTSCKTQFPILEERNNFPEIIEAVIDLPFVSKFCRMGAWIGSYYYYCDREENVKQDNIKRPHYRVDMRAPVVDALVTMIRAVHKVTVFYSQLGMMSPIEYVPPTYLASPLNMPDHTILSEDCFQFEYDEEPEYYNELSEICTDLTSPVELALNNLSEEPINLADTTKYIAQVLLDVIPEEEVVKFYVTYKKATVAMIHEPAIISMMSIDKKYTDLVKTIEFVFCDREQLLFPSSCLNYTSMNFSATYELEPLFMHYMTWAQVFRARLVSKKYYMAYRQMIIAYQAYFTMITYLPDDHVPVEQYTTMYQTDSEALDRRDGRCSHCQDFRCVCPYVVSTYEDIETIVVTYFNNDYHVYSMFKRLKTRFGDLMQATYMALGSIFCDCNSIKYSAVVQYQVPMLPWLLLEEAKRMLHRIPVTNSSFNIEWKGKAYRYHPPASNRFRSSLYMGHDDYSMEDG